MTIVLIFAVVVVLARWGGLVFFAYACWHLLRGEWPQAVVAILLACFIALVRSLAHWLDWTISGRRAWLQHRAARARAFSDDASF